MASSLEPEEYVVLHVREALAQDGRVSELGLEVSVRGGVLHITGPVSTEERRAAVAEVAGEIAPELTVANETHVMRYSGDASVEVLP
jgi:ribosome recycling factor